MKNNNKIYIIIIVMLILMLVGLITYIVMNDKFTAKPNLESSQISTNNNDSFFVKLPTATGQFSPGYTDQNVTRIFLDDLIKNDNLNLNQNFQNVKLNKYGIDYTVSCESYDSDASYDPHELRYNCISAKITIGKSNYYTSTDLTEGSDLIYALYLYNNYIVELYQSSSCGSIRVFKNYDLIYENMHVISYNAKLGVMSDVFDPDRLPIEITNNKVFFFDDYSDGKEAYTSLKSINLDTTSIKEETYIKIPTDLGTGNCYENGVSFD